MKEFLELPVGGKMKWTDKPTEPGFYWVKFAETNRPMGIYCVDLYNDFNTLKVSPDYLDELIISYFGPIPSPSKILHIIEQAFRDGMDHGIQNKKAFDECNNEFLEDVVQEGLDSFKKFMRLG